MLIEYFLEAFVEEFPVFMIILTFFGLAIILQIVKIASKEKKQKDKNFLLGIGLLSLFVGFLVFPVETLQMLHALEVAGEQTPAVVIGGLYLTFVPFFYGLFWFLIALGSWLFYNNND